MAEEKSKLVRFAKRHLNTFHKTFDAGSALWRAEALLDDAASLLALKDQCKRANVDFGVYGETYEIVAYYGVGFVTCLEWHARSRRVDMMVYRPDLITKKDVEQIDRVAVSQMMSEQVTVPYLLGAATTVHDMNDYVAVFAKLYEALGIKESPRKILQELLIASEWAGVVEEKPVFDVLQDMYEARHRLVHEIDMSVIGAYSLRDVWSIDSAIQLGNAVISCIRTLEETITTYGPPDFPNRLDKDGTPESEIAKVEDQIAELEAKLDRIFESQKEFEDVDGWRAALNATRASMEQERAFIRNAEFLQPLRVLNISEAVQLELLKHRLIYLKVLLDEVTIYDDGDGLK